MSGLPDYERLGVFYLGRRYDLDQRRRLDEALLYDSRDLVTHAVCVGMTGSGKTGLCIGLIEEAAIDGIPVIAIDPKGDLPNLLLTFPELRPEDFAPWVNPDEARRKDLPLETYAASQATLWRDGLVAWDEDGERIRRLRDAADFAVYTPGSSAGLGVSILSSFACPPREVFDDRDLLRERVSTTVTSLLALAGINGDPVRSREHILLSTIIGHAWEQGRDLDLAALVQEVQAPPVTRVGVMEVDSFFPPKERFDLAMRLNSLLASPGFAAWMEGEPLDIGAMLHTKEGRPRVSIFSIAHLGEAERMFFVSLLLTQLLGWMRAQSGTTSLRAMLYMDEIAGYCPPVANPPSKAPLLTLLKQARAYGVGVVLATQNPVDLDYKGLSNTGTWFIGRLQTEQDKARVLDGLQGASAGGAGLDRARLDAVLSQLGNRVFLMSNVHEDAPVVFETRWALSYLRGPLTRAQIRTLMDERRSMPDVGREAVTSAPDESGAVSGPDASPGSAAFTRAGQDHSPPGVSSTSLAGSAGVMAASMSPAQDPPAAPVSTPLTAVGPGTPGGAAGAAPADRPVLPPGIDVYHVAIRHQRPEAVLRYRPALLGLAQAHVRDAKLGVEVDLDGTRLATFTDGPILVEWQRSEPVGLREQDLRREPERHGIYEPIPAPATSAPAYRAWKRELTDVLARQLRVTLLHCPELDCVSRPGEREGEFRARLQLVAREERDASIEALRAKYGPKLQQLEDRVRRAEDALQVQRAQVRDAQVSTAASVGTALLGVLFGRRRSATGTASRAGTAARGVSRTAREAGDVRRAEEQLATARQRLAALRQELEEKMAAIAARVDATTMALEPLELRPRRSAVKVHAVVLVWLPMWEEPDGRVLAAWR